MKKVTITLLLLVALTGLLGCRTTRATLKTDTKQEVRQEQVTDSSRAQQTTTSDRINAALSSNEQQNVVIEFDEWEYYPAANDTTTGGNYAQNLADFIRDANGEADKPPNTGSVKKHRKGTITINSDRQTKETKEQETTSSTDTKITANIKTKTDTKTKEKTKSTETTGKSKWYIWLVVGLVFAVLLIWIGRDIARRANG